MKKTTEEFIEDAKKIHNNKYDYSLVNYINSKTKIKIICSVHGEFEQRIDIHLAGHGCRKCYDESKMNKKYLDIVNKLYNNFYIYPDGYTDTKNKIRIICPIHGEFFKFPHHHKNGDGCNKCKIDLKNKKKLDEFIEKSKIIHNNKFDYSKSIYTGYKKDITITCPIHGDFVTKPILHLNGHDCKKCSIDKTKKEHTLFIEECNKIHNNFYIYPEKYVDANSKIQIICPIHGPFYQIPKNHTSNKHGCPSCRKSKGEEKIESILKELKVNYISQKKFKDCKYKLPLPFDFYLLDYNICIEFDGEQHYRENIKWGGVDALKLQQIKDDIKTNYCEKNNITLIRIKYDEDVDEKLKFLIPTPSLS